MPSLNHSILQAILIGVLLQQYSNDYTVVSELSLELETGKATPDICLYPKMTPDWQRDQIRVTTPPHLVIEILSPTQGMQELTNRMEIYFGSGVNSCWIVNPTLETIAVFTAISKPRVFSEGEVVDGASGISVRLDDIF